MVNEQSEIPYGNQKAQFFGECVTLAIYSIQILPLLLTLSVLPHARLLASGSASVWETSGTHTCSWLWPDVITTKVMICKSYSMCSCNKVLHKLVF